jgi:2,5-furandicarboxylate decarboxylase 1
MHLGFRSFIEQLQKNGELTHITKAISTEYEIASVIEALGEKPVFFENVKESSYPVVGGLVSSKDLIARAIGTTKDQLLPILSKAIDNPIAPVVVEKGECRKL